MITITDKDTRFHSKDGAVLARLDNQVVWQPGANEKVIIAVGSPHEWRSRQPLPSGAVQTDLVAASMSQPELANLFWGHFVGYVVATAKMSILDGMKHAFQAHSIGVDVRIAIADPQARAAVRNAIHGSPARFKLKVREAS